MTPPERKDALNEDQLRQAYLRQREFISNLSHDLRSPLTAAQGFLETVLMKDATLSSAERQHFLNKAFEKLNTLNHLMENLFSNYRHNNGLMPVPEPEPFSIRELFQDIILKHHPRTREKQQTLTTRIPGNLPDVVADIRMTEQAISELLMNAVIFAPVGGEILLSAEQEEQTICIAVQDNGAGIPEGARLRVFDPFFKGDRSRSPGGKGGSGLGLTLARDILLAHDQEIHISLPAEGGTRISFRLPQA